MSVTEEPIQGYHSQLDQPLREKLDIPLDHLDYGYIGKSTNVRELEKILRVLRSGEEGVYPDLTQYCVDRIKSMDIDNKAIRKSKPVETAASLPTEEWKEIESDLSNWSDNIKTKEKNLRDAGVSGIGSHNLPPVRAAADHTYSSVRNVEGMQQDQQKSRSINLDTSACTTEG
ncbi:PREDICTED: sperm-associated antigen 1-like [Priapulus caudatus]|uniref:Sperm-associated antigen 1-like n=1 Tax=Priapulus caudatus TaxID=37621 RepID=A0ABM1E786_PRICU|nr:PREDICTED: sperm-associated antigen 1-like [Priapulus caudatus]